MLSSENTSDKVTIKPQTRACSLFRSLKNTNKEEENRGENGLFFSTFPSPTLLSAWAVTRQKSLSPPPLPTEEGPSADPPPSPSQSSQAPSPFARSRKLLLSVGPLLEGGEGRGTFLPPPVIEDESVEGGSLHRDTSQQWRVRVLSSISATGVRRKKEGEEQDKER